MSNIQLHGIGATSIRQHFVFSCSSLIQKQDRPYEILIHTLLFSHTIFILNTMIVDIVFVVLVILLVFAIYQLKFKNDANKIKTTTAHNLPEQPVVNARTHPNQQNQQQRAGPQWARNLNQEEANSSGSDQDSEGEDNVPTTLQERKKQLRKEQKSKMKQQRKEALDQMLEQQKNKRQKQQQEEEEKERLEEEKRQKQEMYYRMLAEEEQKKKKAEYEKWKDMFTVEEEGKSKESAEEEQRRKEEMLKNFLNTLKKNKLSLLEDLAHKFKLTTTETIEKIKELEAREQIKGIFDERGKYMVIEPKQWEAIRNYIEARGRLKKTDIMQECARIIKIPDNSNIDEEMLSLIEKESQPAR